MRPRVQRYRRRLARPIGSAWVAPKNGSAAGERQSTSSRRPAVGEPESSDVDGLGVVGADHAPEAQVEAEAAQGAQAGRQPVDLQVALHRLLARCGRVPCARRRAGRTASAIVCSRLSRDGREVLFVAGDQGRVGLGGEAVWEGRTRWWSGLLLRIVVSSADQYAPRPGPCGKAPSVRYPESGEQAVLSFLVSTGDATLKVPASHETGGLRRSSVPLRRSRLPAVAGHW